VVSQNDVDLLECEGGSSSETCVTFSADGAEEVSIKVEDIIHIKEENVREAVTFPSIKTETEVRVCDGSSSYLLDHLLPYYT
jgi:hypothetical protein